MEEVETAGSDVGSYSYEDHVAVVGRLSLPRNGLGAKVHQEYHVVELEDGLVEEYGQTPKSCVIIED